MICRISEKFPITSEVLRPEEDTDTVHPRDRQDDDEHRHADVGCRSAKAARRVIRPLRFIQNTNPRMRMMIKKAVPNSRPISLANSPESAKSSAKLNGSAVMSAESIALDALLHVDLGGLELHLIGVVGDLGGVDEHDHQTGGRRRRREIGVRRRKRDRDLPLDLGREGFETGQVGSLHLLRRSRWQGRGLIVRGRRAPGRRTPEWAAGVR